MTALVTTNGTERRAAAEAWRVAADRGEALTGAQLAERFDMSPSWGRTVIRQAKAAAAAPERHEDGDQQAATAPEAPAGASQGPDDAAGVAAVPRRPWYDSAVVLVVAAVAAAASYGHMQAVAVLAGEPGWIAAVFPVTVDGLVLAALRRGSAGRSWLLLGLAVSVGANVLAQFPELAVQAGPVVSAWPPLALYGTHRLLHGRR